MGLDMYLNGERFFMERPFTREHQLKAEIYQLGYWRKHPNLHGFIVETFAAGVDECQPIGLNAADLETIMQAVKGKELPPTGGFFFGASDGTEVEDDLRILSAALAWLRAEDKGVWRSVTYQASW
jgi:hypothetical protein